MNQIILEKEFSHFNGYSQERYSLLLKHSELVEEANKTTNITRITGFEEAMYLHVYDSLLGLEALHEADQGCFADLGSGAGYPGIPLSVFSGRECILIDSSKKKIEILKGFISEMELENQVSTLSMRAEEAAVNHAGAFTAVCSRAVGSLAALMELAVPLLSLNGLLIAYKGPDYAKEVDTALTIQQMLGIEITEVREYLIPFNDSKRAIIISQKLGEPTIALPRANGRAQRRPLA